MYTQMVTIDNQICIENETDGLYGHYKTFWWCCDDNNISKINSIDQW